MIRCCIRKLASALVFTTFAASAAVTKGDVVLTVDTDETRHVFTMADLRALPVTEVRTRTIWTDGMQTFHGVSLHDLVQEAAPEGGSIMATAINDYSVEIPASDVVKSGPIVAYRQNGKAMSRRDKGPLWIVYPFDSNPRYQSETYFSRSIWQLDRMSIQ